MIKEIYSARRLPIQGQEYDGFSTIADGSKVADPSLVGFPHRPIYGIMGGATTIGLHSPLGDVRPCDKEALGVMHHIYLAITFVGVTALVFAALVALGMALG